MSFTINRTKTLGRQEQILKLWTVVFWGESEKNFLMLCWWSRWICIVVGALGIYQGLIKNKEKLLRNHWLNHALRAWHSSCLSFFVKLHSNRLKYDSIPARFSCNLPEKILRNMSTRFNQCFLKNPTRIILTSRVFYAKKGKAAAYTTVFLFWKKDIIYEKN